MNCHHHTDAELIWTLFLGTPLVPLLDRWLPGERLVWRGTASSPIPDKRLSTPTLG